MDTLTIEDFQPMTDDLGEPYLARPIRFTNKEVRIFQEGTHFAVALLGVHDDYLYESRRCEGEIAALRLAEELEDLAITQQH
jgi:hypothetical protein